MTDLKDIIDKKRSRIDEFYDLLWQLLGIAVGCGLVWLMGKLIII